MIVGRLLKFLTRVRKVCTNYEDKDVFFGSSITRITKHHIQPATKVEQLLATNPEDNIIWNNIDPCDVSLDDTSDTEDPASIDVTKESVTTMTTPMSIKDDNNMNVTQVSVTTTTTPISVEDDKIWYDANEEYDSWHEVAENMNNYQEWGDPPTVLKDTDKSQPIDEHIESGFYDGKHHTGRLKPSISPFNTRYQFLYYMFYKIIYLILFCAFEVSAITSKSIIYIFETLSKVITSTPNVISNWLNKPHMRYTKKQCK